MNEFLFARALGPAFAALPEPVRAVHSPVGALRFVGRAEVLRGRHPLANLAAALFRLPRAGSDVPVAVAIEPDGDGEVWTRDFGGSRFSSRMSGAGPNRLREQFGLLDFELDVPASSDGLSMAVRGWRLGPLPLPRALAPNTEAREFVDATGRFRFDVRLDLPVVGLLVHYRGWLTPEEP